MKTNTVLEYVNTTTGETKYKTLKTTHDESINGIKVTVDYVAGYLQAIEDSGVMKGWDINILNDVPVDDRWDESVEQVDVEDTGPLPPNEDCRDKDFIEVDE